MLNILRLIDLGLWKNKHLKDLITVLDSYGQDSYEQNKLLLSYNPLMTISLSAEILTKIGKSRKKLENQCMRIKKELLTLG